MGGYLAALRVVMEDKGLTNGIFGQKINLNILAQEAPAKVDQVCSRWRVPKEVGQDISKLSLFDIIIFIGKMDFPD